MYSAPLFITAGILLLASQPLLLRGDVRLWLLAKTFYFLGVITLWALHYDRRHAR